MLTIALALAACALTFWLGYHLGHQIGITEPIRRHLREARQRRQDAGGGLGEHSSFSGS